MGRITEGNVSSKKRKTESHEGEPRRKKTISIPSAMNSHSVVQDNDIIYLNVGGEAMACSRSTLCQVDGSYLASMFSGRWENQLKKDKDGSIFLNFDPVYFRMILRFLRAKEISIPEYPPSAPEVGDDDFPRFYNLVNYLGLKEAFDVACECDKFDELYFNTFEGGTLAKHNSEGGKYYGGHVTGEKLCQSGQMQWRLKVVSKEDATVYVGVLEKDDDEIGNKFICYCSGAHFWADDGYVYQNGKHTINESSRIIPIGVTCVLTLDLDKMKLYLSNGKDTMHMKLTRNKNMEHKGYGWSLCIGFDGDKAEVQLLV